MDCFLLPLCVASLLLATRHTGPFFFIGILPRYIFIGFRNRFSRGRECGGGNPSARHNIHTYPQILAVRGSLPEENGCCFNTGFFVHLKVPQRLTLGVSFCSGLRLWCILDTFLSVSRGDVEYCGKAEICCYLRWFRGSSMIEAWKKQTNIEKNQMALFSIQTGKKPPKYSRIPCSTFCSNKLPICCKNLRFWTRVAQLSFLSRACAPKSNAFSQKRRSRRRNGATTTTPTSTTTTAATATARLSKGHIILRHCRLTRQLLTK